MFDEGVNGLPNSPLSSHTKRKSNLSRDSSLTPFMLFTTTTTDFDSLSTQTGQCLGVERALMGPRFPCSIKLFVSSPS